MIQLPSTTSGRTDSTSVNPTYTDQKRLDQSYYLRNDL